MKNALKGVRQARGMTSEGFVAYSGIGLAREQYSLIENGHVLPILADLLLICEALGLSPLALFGPDLDLMRGQRIWRRTHGEDAGPSAKRQGNPELRTRMEAEERRQFLDDIRALGYADYAAWVRGMAAEVHAQRERLDRIRAERRAQTDVKRAVYGLRRGGVGGETGVL